ncbi:MAG: hypothetical protein Q9170_001492 [Blastenia crenularia]
MDPFSITAGVDDYKLADADLDIARQHAVLLEAEIRALESTEASRYSLPHRLAKENHVVSHAANDTHAVSEEAPFSKAIATAHELLSTINAAFPLRSEPHTWRSKVRWVMKDKQVLAQLKERLKSTESTLQGIATMEQL